MKQIYLLVLLFSTIVNAQIELVKDINTGLSSSNPEHLTVYKNLIYFSAHDESGINTNNIDYGRELWVSDGTSEGTRLLKNINTNNQTDEYQDSNPYAFFNLNEVFYFSALDNQIGFPSIFSTNGTEESITPINNNYTNLQPVVVNGKAYMTATNFGDTFYQFDGTTHQQVPDVGVGTATIVQGQYTELNNNNLLAYMNYSTDVNTVGSELYLYNISNQTYSFVKDINEGTGDASISNFTKLGNNVYFEANFKLWVTDGTSEGTNIVAAVDIRKISNVANLFAWNGQLFFEGDTGIEGDQLYVYDPISNTVINISNIEGDAPNHDPSGYAALDNYLYYRGEDGADNEGHLFRTDGTKIEQLNTSITDVGDIVVLDNKLYFRGNNNGVTGNELFVFDPSNTLNTDNFTANNSLTIYPNPSVNFINIESSLTGNIDYTFYTLLGKKVLAGSSQNKTIQHNLPTGIYFLNLKNNDNSITKKIVVKK